MNANYSDKNAAFCIDNSLDDHKNLLKRTSSVLEKRDYSVSVSLVKGLGEVEMRLDGFMYYGENEILNRLKRDKLGS